MSLYDKSSLVLIPSGTKTGKVYSQVPVSGDGDFTFTRSSAATRVNADGNIEKETQNLLLQSNSFNTWISNNTSETSGQSGYDGTNDAWLLAKSAASAYMYVNNTVSGVQTFSIYAKSGSLSWMRIVILGAVDFADAFFNLADGSLGANSGLISGSSESITGGWYRYSLTINGSHSQVRIYPADFNGNVSGTSGNILIQDAQREQGLVARDYIETTTSAVEGGITDNVPRLDYTDSSCPALLLEPQRTNLLPQSEYIGAWIKANTTTEDNVVTSPEGVVNATRIIENYVNASHQIYDDFSATSGQVYTLSFFAKKNGRDIGVGMASGIFGSNSTYFDLTNGVVISTTSEDASIEDYGDGWFRCSVTNTANSSGNPFVYILLSNNANFVYTGDGTSGVYIYGIQVEAGSYATSYIPTYGSSVTRTQDKGSIPSASSLIGQTEGTLFVKFKHTNEAIGLVGINAGNIGNRLYIGTDTNGLISQVRVSYSTQAFFATPLTIGTTYKCALAYKENDFVLYVNGNQIGVDTNGLVPSSLSRIAFQQANDNDPMPQPLSEVLVFKTRLSNEELADLTTL